MTYLIVLIAISFCTATSLILTNKKIMNNYGFECPTFLTSYHFLLSAILLEIMGRMNFFTIDKSMPTLVRWGTAAFGVGSIVFLNLNLKVNSIGFYQLSKLLNIPFMVIYKFIVQNKTTPFESLCSLAVLLTGMALFTVNDVQFSIFGAIIALTAILCTTVYQSLSASHQSTYSITGTQLNHIVAYPQFVICIVSALIMETNGKKSIFNHKFQNFEIFLILLTGAFAVYGNVIGFIMIGKTGPVSFQVIGHVKTILIFVFGLIMFPPTQAETKQQKIKKIIGLIISMVGVISYTFFELKIKQKERFDALKEEENDEIKIDVDVEDVQLTNKASCFEKTDDSKAISTEEEESV